MSRTRPDRDRHSFVHRLATGVLTLGGSVLLGMLIGVSEPHRHDGSSG